MLPKGMMRIERGGRSALAGAALVLAVFAVAMAAPAGAQQEDPWRLSLDEAVELAKRNNPAYLQVLERISAAEWGVREAYASFLPSVNASTGMQYVGAGTQRFGIFTGEDIGAGSTDYYLSDYALSLDYRLSGATLFNLSSARADRDAAHARRRAAEYDLEFNVTRQYLAAVRARDAVEVTQRQLDRAEESYELASARAEAGAVPGTDAKQAEVERGRAEVALIQAENDYRVQVLGLLEQIGVLTNRPVVLVSSFDVFEPEWSQGELVARALESHPQLRSFNAAESARRAGLREARTSYLPSVSASATWSGFTRELGNTDFILGQARSSIERRRESCQFFNQIAQGLDGPLEGYPTDCSTASFVLTDEEESQILQRNDVFPFDFQRQPVSLGFRVSLPLFQGFTRQRQVEEAEVQARTATQDRRAEELRLRTVVTTAHGSLASTHRVVEIEARNREVATEQLELARERYRMGAAPFLELLDAQSSMATAERDYLNAVYDFHQALAQLEQASGQDLRQARASDEEER